MSGIEELSLVSLVRAVNFSVVMRHLAVMMKNHTESTGSKSVITLAHSSSPLLFH